MHIFFILFTVKYFKNVELGFINNFLSFLGVHFDICIDTYVWVSFAESD